MKMINYDGGSFKYLFEVNLNVLISQFKSLIKCPFLRNFLNYKDKYIKKYFLNENKVYLIRRLH